ncbi:unnamed protein product, partial [marine sediment metagenome]
SNTMKDKRANFIRLAEQRTNKVLKALRTLGHCSNTHLYEYDNEQIEAIFERIEQEVAATKAKFEREGKVFSLRE